MENQNNNSEQKIKRKSLITFIFLVVFFMLSMWGCAKAVLGAEEETSEDSKSSFVTYMPGTFTPGVEQYYTLPNGSLCTLYPDDDVRVPNWRYVVVFINDNYPQYHVAYSRYPFCVRSEIDGDGNYKYSLHYNECSFFTYDFDGNCKGYFSSSGVSNTGFYVNSGYVFASENIYTTDSDYSGITSEVFQSSSVQPRTEVAGMTGQEIATAVLLGAVGLVSCAIGLLVAFKAFRKGWGFLKTTLHKA